MPKTPTDYSKTVIYKIQHIDKDDLLYVGSTTDFTRRKAEHKRRCKTKTTKLYEMIKDNGGWEMFNMIIVKNFCCDNGQEAKREEDRVMREMKANMNTKRAYTTNEEKREYIKQYQEQYYKQYYEQNKERYKEYYEQNKEKLNKKIICVCGYEITKHNLPRHRRTNKHRKILIQNGIDPDELIY
jgi:hypothetical protein